MHGQTPRWLPHLHVPRGSTTTNHPEIKSQVAWSRSAPNRVTDHDPSEGSRKWWASGDQTACAWCHDGGQVTVFTAVPGRSLLSALASGLRK